MKRHWEILSARKYYGRHARFSVVLLNGHVAHHGPVKECRDTIKNVERVLVEVKKSTLFASKGITKQTARLASDILKGGYNGTDNRCKV